jgi:hypothetical protein
MERTGFSQFLFHNSGEFWNVVTPGPGVMGWEIPHGLALRTRRSKSRFPAKLHKCYSTRCISQTITLFEQAAQGARYSDGSQRKFSMPRAAPVAASQSFTVSSHNADATSLPSGEKAMAPTVPMALERLRGHPRCCVPEPDGFVPRCRRYQLTVRREGPPAPNTWNILTILRV